MRLLLDQAVIDLATGEQAKLEGRDVTLRLLIIKVGTNPHAEDAQKPMEAVTAWELAAKAAAAPVGGYLDLSTEQASLLKTRAFGVLFIQWAGPLHEAIEKSHEAAEKSPAQTVVDAMAREPKRATGPLRVDRPPIED